LVAAPAAFLPDDNYRDQSTPTSAPQPPFCIGQILGSANLLLDH
jgi:hypothetical protein